MNFLGNRMSELAEKLRLIEKKAETVRLEDVANLIRSEAERLHLQKVGLTEVECKRLKSLAEDEIKLLKKEIRSLRDHLAKLGHEVCTEQKLRDQLMSTPVDQIREENVKLKRELSGLSNIWCIRQGDCQGGRWDRCFHFRADSRAQVEALMKTGKWRYNSGVVDFEFRDIRGQTISPPTPVRPIQRRGSETSDDE